jgi:N-acetylgalactosamine-6-sulfatase
MQSTGAALAAGALTRTGLAQTTTTSTSKTPPPNFVFFIADDLGWGDLGCCGHPYLLTPNADRLARQGTRFTQYYANHAVCSPSRAALLTGHFPARHRVHGGLPDPSSPVRWLDSSVVTVPRLLQKAGYATAHYGKWHLGSDREAPKVTEYGFDDHRGTLSSGPPLWDDPAALKDPYHRAKATGRIVDLGLDFIRRRRDGQPFYLHLASLVPHHPLKPTPEEQAVYDGKTFDPGVFAAPTREYLRRQEDPQAAMRTYYAALSGWDKQLGRLLDELETLGVAHDTVVVLTSDHGPAHESAVHPDQAGSTGPFRGRKGSLLEGGVRVPFIARWPGTVPAGRVDDAAVLSGVDWLPTVCGLTGIAPPPAYKPDGEDMAAVLRGGARARAKPLFWERSFGEAESANPLLAMRSGDWKLHMKEKGDSVELYNVVQDPAQSRDLAVDAPDRASRMKAELLEWRRSLPWK